MTTGITISHKINKLLHFLGIYNLVDVRDKSGFILQQMDQKRLKICFVQKIVSWD